MRVFSGSLAGPFPPIREIYFSGAAPAAGRAVCGMRRLKTKTTSVTAVCSRYTHQALARLTLVYPLLTTAEPHVRQLLVGARRLRVTVGATRRLHVIAVGAIARRPRATQTSGRARAIRAFLGSEPRAVVHFDDRVVAVLVQTA